MASDFLTGKEEIVDGRYRLGALIRRSVGGTIYETQFEGTEPGEGVVKAAIKIRDCDLADAENLRQRLRNAGQLAHPNLLNVYAAGRSVLYDVPVFYVVMERADESLEGVLAERALTESETREILLPVLEALQYIHNRGYAHSSLKASNVLAVNDQLKLSTDSVVRVNDGGSPAEDIRALGILIIHALTQRIPDADESRQSHACGEIPQPLADIVWHCLDADPTSRWTVEQVKARLSAPAIEPLLSKPSPVEKSARSEQDSAAGGVRGGITSGVPKWIYPALAALILTVFLAAVMRNRDSVPVPAPVITQYDGRTPATGSTTVEPDGSGAASARQVTPAPRPAAAPAGAQPSEKKAVGARKASGWTVIVGAYGAREPAEKWVREMTRRWPNFEIRVLETQAEKTPYLVVLGENLSEDRAEALRQRAVEAGLPRHTYIKRVM